MAIPICYVLLHIYNIDLKGDSFVYKAILFMNKINSIMRYALLLLYLIPTFS